MLERLAAKAQRPAVATGDEQCLQTSAYLQDMKSHPFAFVSWAGSSNSNLVAEAPKSAHF